MTGETVPDSRPYLILVNPKSGPGHAVMLFQRYVAPKLSDAGVHYELVVTSHAGEACRQLQQLEQQLSRWAAVVVVSGDGLLYEVYNGLLARAFSTGLAALRTPVAIVAAGSGNGLAASVAASSGLISEFVHNPVSVSCRALTRGHTLSLDLMLVQTADEKLRVAFLSLGWGLLADIDIESERLRVLGGARFSVWALVRLAALRSFTGTLYLLLATDQETCRNGPNHSTEISDESKREERNKADDDTDVPCMRLCPPLSEPITDPRWTVIEGEFVQVYASLPSHISATGCLNPDASLSDGLLHVHVLRGGLSRYRLLRYLMALGYGRQSQLPYVCVYRVHALRLVPHSHSPTTSPSSLCSASSSGGSRLTLDGELVPYGPLQLEVMPGAGRVLAPLL